MTEENLYSVEITNTAWEQMIEYARFLANVSVQSANRLVDAFVETARTLVQNPERCPWLEHEALPFQKYRKILFGKHYLALYEIRGDTVYLAAVVDGRQDYAWLLYLPQ